MPETPIARPPGRPAAASRDEALAHAVGLYLRGERVDLRRIALELGVGRTTVHRWFGTRDDLLGDVLAATAVELLRTSRAHVGGRGGRALLETFDHFNRALLEVPALRVFFDLERDALAIISRADHGPQPALIAAIAGYIADEVDGGRYVAPTAPATLALAIVQLATAFLYADAATGVRGDVDQLRTVEALVLGLPPDR